MDWELKDVYINLFYVFRETHKCFFELGFCVKHFKNQCLILKLSTPGMSHGVEFKGFLISG